MTVHIYRIQTFMLNYKMPYICRKIKRGEKANFSSFCDCVSKLGRSSFLTCSCGEEEENGWVEWTWDPGDQGTAACNPHGTARFISRGFGRPPGVGSPLILMKDNRQVMFHPSYSTGTAAIRGEHPLEPGMHHYWEVKILTPLYGTDIMVGVGAATVELRKDSYCSLLGEDNESWGYSYNGNIQHGGHRSSYGYPFGLGSIVGVHVDLWHGRLEFYLNRKPLGVAFTNLHGKTLFPLASSTAARSGIRLIHASSHPHSLLFSCTRALGVAADASSSESQPSKRLCLNNSASARNSSPGASVPLVHNTYRYVVNGPNHNPSRFKDCELPSPSSNSIRGAHFCSPSARMDGTEKETISGSCDTMRCASVIGCCSNLESGRSGTAEPVGEPSRTVIAVFKRDQPGHWSNANISPGRCKDETVSIDCKVGCAQSNATSGSICNRSENHYLNETIPNITIREPYFLSLPQGNEENSTPQSDQRKRKQPSCDSVERIWSIPGLRAKVECSFWWLLGTRRGKGVTDVNMEAATSHRPLIIVDDDDDRRIHHGMVSKSSNEENVHHQSTEGSVSQTCHERLCLMCHPVI
ncbi:hypothetical protein J437_LFUL003524 [Ladona fulva]|uniref:B30.2/SPRY domain-containing protein n=1 Tax=Ladona fulva TaxID=123851 RepID=A0A8K0JV33_LADFU|nr:hypothetical protein J437_LFUL003524 [Ladona fulva]